LIADDEKMKTLADIRRQLAAGEFEFSRHALHRVVERNIAEQEIREAGANAEVIEDYPDDKYSPSALLLGFTAAGRPLHFQVSYAETDMTKIITIYQPNPAEWENHRKRR
jgi:hypothetical protein